MTENIPPPDVPLAASQGDQSSFLWLLVIVVLLVAGRALLGLMSAVWVLIEELLGSFFAGLRALGWIAVAVTVIILIALAGLGGITPANGADVAFAAARTLATTG